MSERTNHGRRRFLTAAAMTLASAELGIHNYRWRLGLAEGEPKEVTQRVHK